MPEPFGAQYAVNDATGEVRKKQGDGWVKVQSAVNDSGEVLINEGQGWGAVPSTKPNTPTHAQSYKRDMQRTRAQFDRTGSLPDETVADLSTRLQPVENLRDDYSAVEAEANFRQIDRDASAAQVPESDFAEKFYTAANGPTFGNASRLQGGISAALAVPAQATRLFGMDPQTPGEAMESGKARADTHIDRMHEDAPIASVATELAGGVLSGKTVFDTIAKGPAWVRAIVSGAGTGGLYAVSDSDGAQKTHETGIELNASLDEHIEAYKNDALLGAVVGGLSGAGLQVGGEYIIRPAFRWGKGKASGLYDNIARALGREGGALDKHNAAVAVAVVQRAMDRSGMTFDEVLEKVRLYEDKPAVLAEVIGQNAVNKLTALTRGKGTTPQKAQAIVEERFGGFNDRAQGDLAAASGVDRASIDGDMEGMVEAGREAAQPMYRALFDAFSDIKSKRLESLLNTSPTLQKHMKTAEKALADEAAFKGVTPERMSNMQRFDYLKRSLDDAINAAEGKATTRTGESVADLTKLKNTILRELDRLTDGQYAKVREAGGVAPRLESARKVGEKVTTTKPKELRETVQVATPDEQQAIKMGVTEKIGSQFDEGRMKPQRFRTQANQDRMTATLGDEAGGEFLNKMEAEAQLAELAARWGPRTSSVSGTVAENGSAQMVDDLTNAGIMVARGDKIGMIRHVMSFMQRRGLSPSEQDAIGDLLLSNPVEGLQRLGRLDASGLAAPAAQTGNGVTQALDARGQIGTGQADRAPVVGNGVTAALSGSDLAAGGAGAIVGGLNPMDANQDGETSLGERGASAVAGAASGIALKKGMKAAGVDIDPNQMGTFGGQLSKTSDRSAMRKARLMGKDGASPREQHKATGWYRDVDGQLKYEIDDSASRWIAPKIEEGAEWKGTVEDVFQHDELFAAYPELKNVELRIKDMGELKWDQNPRKMDGHAGTNYDGKRIDLNSRMTPDEMRSTLLHELDHSIQAKEGFAYGSNAQSAPAKYDAKIVKQIEESIKLHQQALRDPKFTRAEKQEFKDWIKRAKRDVQQAAKQEGYLHTAGEAAARNTQTRMRMSAAERRASFPDDTLDIAPDERTVQRGLPRRERVNPWNSEAQKMKAAQSRGYKGGDSGEAEEWLSAKRKGLDMSTEGRMARAKEMGFDTETTMYHGTDAEFEAFNISKEGALGPGVYVGDSRRASRYGVNGSVLPIYVRGPKAVYSDVIEAQAEGWAEKQRQLNDDELNKMLSWMGFTHREGPGGTVVFDPKNIRSVHAAFDPEMAASPNLMASAGRAE